VLIRKHMPNMVIAWSNADVNPTHFDMSENPFLEDNRPATLIMQVKTIPITLRFRVVQDGHE